jgi:prolyl-tRNA synthetase
MTRGIEVGNIFQLGTKYSKSMNATYTAEDGTEQPFVMGCYGIGVSRTAAAAIERFHDKWGIIWPMQLAPYQVIVVPVNTQDETQMTLAEKLYADLKAATVDGKPIEVVIDDRDERAGVKFKDADLIGFPIRVTAGKKAAEGLLEVKLRDQDQATDIPADQVLSYVQQQIREWRPFAKISQPATV